jgi:hypothetical protein
MEGIGLNALKHLRFEATPINVGLVALFGFQQRFDIIGNVATEIVSLDNRSFQRKISDKLTGQC